MVSDGDLTNGLPVWVGRVIAVDRKVVDIAGRLFLEAPKSRKQRKTIYPRVTQAGYPLADRLAARIDEVQGEQEAGVNPLFPSRSGGYWRSSNHNRRILQPAYRKAGWRDADGDGTWTWTWHSLRHVFCTTALQAS
jgi:integrase